MAAAAGFFDPSVGLVGLSSYYQPLNGPISSEGTSGESSSETVASNIAADIVRQNVPLGTGAPSNGLHALLLAAGLTGSPVLGNSSSSVTTASNSGSSGSGGVSASGNNNERAMLASVT